MSDTIDTLETTDYRASYIYGLLAVPILIGCYFLIDHTWDASTKIEEVTGILYDGTENRTADRSESINAGSSSARIMLACFAMIGLGLPCASRLKASSLTLWFLAAHFAWMCMTYLWADEPGHTLFKLTVLFVFGFTAFGLSRQMSLDQIGRTFALCSVAFILIGILAELRFGTMSILGDYRFTGSTHPNTQAAYGSLACIAAVLFYSKDRRLSLLVSLLVFGIGFACLLLTKSRTSLAAMIIGITAFYAIRFRGINRLILISATTCALGVGALLLTVVSAQLKGAVGNAAAMGRSDDVGQLTGRLPLWEELLEHVAHRPLQGHGYLSMWTAERVETLGDMFHWEIPHAHNMYIDVLLDGGVIGLILFVTLFLIGLITSARRFFATGNDGAAFCFALIFFALVHGCAESFFKQPVFPTLCLVTLMLRLAWRGPEDGELALQEQLDHA